jgi:hypothetical protein
MFACAGDSPAAPDSSGDDAAADALLATASAPVSGPAGNYGAKASGSELFVPGIVTDGGPGALSASISRSNFSAEAAFAPTSTYLPELKAFSRNTTADNSDDITQARAEAYQVFTSSAAQTINLTIQLSAVVEDNATDISFVLSDVFVYGGSDFEVSDSPICPDGRLGRFLFDGTYFCGTRLGRSNLFIPVGDVTLPDLLSFTVSAGETFGIFAVLRANSSGGSADASQTLTMAFDDDQFITAVAFPDDEPLEVAIDVKPGSEPACINPGSKGVIPVAIFGSDELDVTQVVAASLEFGGLSLRERGKKGPVCSMEDVNEDGIEDLVCHFDVGTADWTGGTEPTLIGELEDGTEITGTDTVCLVPKGNPA